MVRKHKKKEKNYTELAIENAIKEMNEKEISIRKVALKYAVPKSVLFDRIKLKKHGGRVKVSLIELIKLSLIIIG